MKHYVVRLLLFLLPVLVLLAILELLLRRIPNDYSVKNEHMEREGADLHFLVLGNSHAYKGVDPDRMGPHGFNVANISQDYHWDRAVLDRYIGSMPRLEHVFIPLSYGSLGARLEQGQEAWRVKNYTLYMGIGSPHFALEHHLELLNRPMVAQLRMLRSHLEQGKNNVLCSSSGMGIAPSDPDMDLEANGRTAALRHLRDDRGADGNADLDAIIATATARGMHVHLFIPPGWTSYRDGLDPVQLANVRAKGLALSSAHELVTFDDLLADPRFVQEDFGDADHLSPSGAIKLSAILAAHLHRP